MTPTKQQISAAFRTAAIVAEAIQELGSVPSGHLYANLASKMSLNSYNGIIDMLKRAELVSEKNHLLNWIGPAK